MSKLALSRLLLAREAQLPTVLGGAILMGALATWYALRPVDPASPAVGEFHVFMGRYEVLTTWMIAGLALLIGIERTTEDAAGQWLHPLTAREDVRLTYVIACAGTVAVVLSALLAFGLAVQLVLGVDLPKSASSIISAALVRCYAAALLGGVLVLLIRSKGLVLVLLTAWAMIPMAALFSLLLTQSSPEIPESLRTLLRWSPLMLVFEGPARFRGSATFAVALTAVAILVAPFTVARKS